MLNAHFLDKVINAKIGIVVNESNEKARESPTTRSSILNNVLMPMASDPNRILRRISDPLLWNDVRTSWGRRCRNQSLRSTLHLSLTLKDLCPYRHSDHSYTNTLSFQKRTSSPCNKLVKWCARWLEKKPSAYIWVKLICSVPGCGESTIECVLSQQQRREQRTQSLIVSLVDAHPNKNGRHRWIGRNIRSHYKALGTGIHVHGQFCPTRTHFLTIFRSVAKFFEGNVNETT